MTSSQFKGARLGLAALGAGMLLTLAPAAAQTRSDDALSHNLRLLAANPKSLTALMGAGRAALELGDAQAALTFFARAENQAPQDGRIKMWIGSALVQLQQPRSALKFFKDAVDLGVTEAEVAKERGLAWDISGEPKRAQADYRLALQRGYDAEVTRRLALSLGITGDREAALQLLEAQLLTRDQQAERTRAMVLGLTGDAAGAARAAQASMPGPAATALAPFLAQLPALNATERALAVHLGHFPRDGRSRPVPPNVYASASGATSTPTQAGRPDSRQPPLARRSVTAEPVSTAPRRRPGSEQPKPPAGRTATAEKTPARSERRAGSGYSAWAFARNLPERRTREREPERKPSPAAPAASAPAPSKPAPAESRTVQVAAATPMPTARQPQAEAAPPPAAPPAVTSAAPATTLALEPTAASPAGQPQPATPTASEATPAQMASSQPAPPQAAPVPAGAAAQPAGQGESRAVQLTELQPSTAPQQTPPVEAVPQPARQEETPIQLADLQPSAVSPSPPPATIAPAASQPVENAPASFRIDRIEPAPTEVRSGSRLADVAAVVATLPDPEPAPKPAKPAPSATSTKKSTPPAKPTSTAAAAKPAAPKKAPAPAAPKEPSRHWVQVAGGADKTALPRTFANLKTKAPKLLGTRTAWTTPLNATNRLLVGPFASSKEAQEFVNELSKLDLSAFAWTSEAGQKIERLAAAK